MKISLSRSILIWCFITFSLLSGTACMNQTVRAPSQRLFEPLYRQDVSDFEQSLAHLKLVGARGDAMTLGIEWLYRVLCISEVPQSTYQDPLWQALSVGLELEALRINSPLLQPLWQLSPKKLKARSLDEAKWAFWPEKKGDQEGWADELPAWLNLSSSCPKELKINYKTVLWPLSLLTSENRVYGFSLAQLYRFLKLDQSIELIDQWKNKRVQEDTHQDPNQAAPTKSMEKTLLIEEWQWWLRFEKAKLLSKVSQTDLGWPPLLEDLSWLQSHQYSESCLLWKKLYQQSVELIVLSPKNRRNSLISAAAQAALVAGSCYQSVNDDQEAYQAWEFAVLSGQDQRAPVALALARYLQLRLLIRLGKYDQALQLKEVLPERHSPLYAPFVYALGEAMSYSGQDDALMALATEAFRDRSWRKDPFLRALFYLFVRSLTRFDFEARVLELLEDLGPRRELYERVYLFAHVALDEGAQQTGSAATRWLLGHHESALWRPRYHALEARAALLRQDKKAFLTALQKISPFSGALIQAIQKGRRGAFFEVQDRALVELLRVEIPRVAGWSSQSRQEKRRRFDWLDLIAQQLQQFLRLRPETKVHKELLALYRAVKQNLPVSRLRAYSEKIGRSSKASVLIGYVRVQGVDLTRLEPRQVSIQVMAAPALTLLPVSNLNPQTWQLDWPQSEMTLKNLGER